MGTVSAMKNSILSQRWPWFVAIVVVIGIFLSYLSTIVTVEIGDQDDRPLGTAADIEALADRDDVNVLYILVDTLRSDRMSSYGYHRETSPVFDKLADRGVRFSRHLAQSSWTKCSMASLWTGLNPNRTGVTRFDHMLAEEATMPAEIFKEAGYQTIGLYRNGWVEGYFGFDQGFDYYGRTNGASAPPSVRRENPTMQNRSTDMSLIPSAVEFTRIYGDKPWFLYVHLMDLHEYLYDEDSAEFGTSYSDVYDNSILRVNLVIKQLMRKLRKGGHLDNTIIVLASDHGEAFSERGLEGHARKVFKESTEVPFIISFPFKLEPGVVLGHRTRNIDAWPTVLDIMGLPALPDADGVSQLPYILAAARGEELAPPAEAPIGISHLDEHWGQRDKEPSPTIAVTEGSFRFVMQPAADSSRVTPEQLFDANRDASELTDHLEQEPEVAERMRVALAEYLQAKPPWGSETESLEMDEMQLNQLRALGYKIP